MVDETNPISVSVAVPLFNEEESAPVLYQQLTNVLEELGLAYEIIFIDDGSSDGTFKVVKTIAAKDKLITRIIPSGIANWLICKVTGVPIKDNGCSMKACSTGVRHQFTGDVGRTFSIHDPTGNQIA